MALGILESTDEHVPGTVYVYEEERRDEERTRSDSRLKTDKTGKIILVPQPSDDPNDPLNQPLWRRDLTLLILALVAVTATTAAPLLAADSVLLANIFVRTFQEAADLTAYHLAGVAVGAVIFVPSARIWGKRHAFLIGALLMVASSAWGGSTHTSKNYKSLLWARVIQGVALAPFESLSNAVIGDLYFVHERGPRMAFINTALFGGAFLCPVFAGIIAQRIDFQWTFYFLAIFMAVGFLLLLFFVPETAFKRADTLNLDFSGVSQSNSPSIPSMSGSERGSEEKKPAISTHASTAAAQGSKRSFTQRLRPFNGRYSNENYFKVLLRPFPLYIQPAVLWGCLLQGVIIGWTVMVGVVLSYVFLSPPLFFSEERAGKNYTSAFVGAIVGLLLSGVFTELVTNWLVKKNNGKYEPEFRIMIAIPTLIFAGIGLFGFGFAAGNIPKFGWLIPDVFIAFIVISMVMGAVGSAQYLLDAHRDMAVEIFTTLIIFKNIFSFILAHFAYTWIFKIGIKEMFTYFGIIEVIICLLSVPMYVLGKKNRAFFHRHDLLKITKLR